MSAEETEKTAAVASAAAAEAPAGDEEEEWLYGGEDLFHISPSASCSFYRYLLSNTFYNHFINHISRTILILNRPWALIMARSITCQLISLSAIHFI